MDSTSLAKYIEQTGKISQPWLLVQLRLKKIQENKSNLSEQDYLTQMAEVHEDLMKLGEWWVGIEDEVFGSE